jgi:hypothetical protein
MWSLSKLGATGLRRKTHRQFDPFNHYEGYSFDVKGCEGGGKVEAYTCEKMLQPTFVGTIFIVLLILVASRISAKVSEREAKITLLVVLLFFACIVSIIVVDQLH